MSYAKLFVCVTVAFLAISAVQAVTIPGRWEKVEALSQGSDIVVRLKAGDRFDGMFKSLTDQGLTLDRRNGGEILLPKSEVLRVERLSRDDNTNGTLIGLGAGFGLGLAVGAIADSSDVKIGSIRVENGGAVYLLGGLAGSGIGALVGYLVDKSHADHEVLYQAP